MLQVEKETTGMLASASVPLPPKPSLEGDALAMVRPSKNEKD